MVWPFNSSPVLLHGPLHQVPVLLKPFWQRLFEEGQECELLYYTVFTIRPCYNYRRAVLLSLAVSVNYNQIE